LQIYNWLIKHHVLALFGHHQAYKEMVLIKVHSLAIHSINLLHVHNRMEIIKLKFENPSPRSLLTFHSFAQLSHLVAVRQGVCCFYLASSFKYTLFSFLKWR